MGRREMGRRVMGGGKRVMGRREVGRREEGDQEEGGGRWGRRVMFLLHWVLLQTFVPSGPDGPGSPGCQIVNIALVTSHQTTKG